MKKKAFLRGLLGFPLGIAIGHVISVLGSLIFGNGAFHPCTPDLIASAGNEINAVLLQTLLCGVVGTSFAASSVIWEAENWSIVKQTGAYFFVNAVFMLPTAYLLNWMEHSLAGFFVYFGIFTLYFAVIWMIQYIVWKHTLKKMNAKIHRMSSNTDTELSEG